MTTPTLKIEFWVDYFIYAPDEGTPERAELEAQFAQFVDAFNTGGLRAQIKARNPDIEDIAYDPVSRIFTGTLIIDSSHFSIYEDVYAAGELCEENEQFTLEERIEIVLGNVLPQLRSTVKYVRIVLEPIFYIAFATVLRRIFWIPPLPPRIAFNFEYNIARYLVNGVEYEIIDPSEMPGAGSGSKSGI